MVRFLRLLGFVSLAAAVAAGMPVKAASELGEKEATFNARDWSGGLLLAARKGTRNYQPDDSEPAAPVGTESQDTGPYSGTQTLESCMALWDPATHMTKSEWRDSCKRILKERSQQPGT